MTARVRLAVPADLSAVRCVGFVTWPLTYGGFAGADFVAHGLDEYWSVADLAPSIAEGMLYVAEVGGAVVGTAQAERTGENLTLWKLYVLPDHQRAGLGRALLDAVKRRAVELGVDLVTEYVAGNAGAGSFYLSQGFQADGDTPATQLDSVWLRWAPPA